jgi:hypothetical protein
VRDTVGILDIDIVDGSIICVITKSAWNHQLKLTTRQRLKRSIPVASSFAAPLAKLELCWIVTVLLLYDEVSEVEP